VSGESKYERFRVTPEELERIRQHNAEVRAAKKRAEKPRPQRKSAKCFVMGPIPMHVLGRAFKAHSAAPLILLALKRELDMKRRREAVIAVTAKLCEGLNISTNSRLRAVRALEAEGMIAVNWIGRKAPLVQLADWLFGAT